MTIVIMDAAMHSITDQTSSESDGCACVNMITWIQRCKKTVEHRQKAMVLVKRHHLYRTAEQHRSNIVRKRRWWHIKQSSSTQRRKKSQTKHRQKALVVARNQSRGKRGANA